MNGKIEKRKIESKFWEGKALIMGSVLGFDSGKDFCVAGSGILSYGGCEGRICGDGSRLWEGGLRGL